MRLLILNLLLASASSLFAAKDHLPLPPQIMAAKTVYIENRSGQAALGDRAYQEIKAWGRFEVVHDRSQADLIFLLSSRERVVGQSGTVDRYGNLDTTSDVRRSSGLTVLDSKTGNLLWTESKIARPLQKSAIKRAIDELRKRMEEQPAESVGAQP
jgi:hypothetical protein